MADFEPKIVAFLCNWCAYGGADLAGVSRLQYPPNLRPVRVMCSGRVDPVFIIQALKEGADGVMVAGCHFGDCHYLEGNYQAETKIRATQKLLEISGIGKDRLHLYWCSSAEAQRFAEIAGLVTDSIKSQGRFDPAAFESELAAAERTLTGEMIRWMVGKEIKITTKGDVYGRRWDRGSFESILDSALDREYQKNLILLAVTEGCASPRDISEKTGLDLKQVSHLLVDLEKTNKVQFKGMEACRPVFAAL
jgi:F420-non-reducing hydrogenase iron-sulfur subunit